MPMLSHRVHLCFHSIRAKLSSCQKGYDWENIHGALQRMLLVATIQPLSSNIQSSQTVAVAVQILRLFCTGSGVMNVYRSHTKYYQQACPLCKPEEALRIRNQVANVLLLFYEDVDTDILPWEGSTPSWIEGKPIVPRHILRVCKWFYFVGFTEASFRIEYCR